ncbi:hypothetical protein LPICM17_680008 [Lactococcus piscium]|nr:hypothetical protein LPICM17_680008 [Lactococcus piscium]
MPEIRLIPTSADRSLLYLLLKKESENPAIIIPKERLTSTIGTSVFIEPLKYSVVIKG